MDPKNIFIACSAMLRKAEWEKAKNDNEWSFVGDKRDFHSSLVQQNVDGFFQEESIYLVTDRHKSKEITKESAAREVGAALDKQDVTLCSKDFKKFIVFSSIGVAKQGVYHS